MDHRREPLGLSRPSFGIIKREGARSIDVDRLHDIGVPEARTTKAHSGEVFTDDGPDAAGADERDMNIPQAAAGLPVRRPR